MVKERGNKEYQVQTSKNRGRGKRMEDGRTDVQEWRQNLLEQIAQ